MAFRAKLLMKFRPFVKVVDAVLRKLSAKLLSFSVTVVMYLCRDWCELLMDAMLIRLNTSAMFSVADASIDKKLDVSIFIRPMIRCARGLAINLVMYAESMKIILNFFYIYNPHHLGFPQVLVSRRGPVFRVLD